MRPWYDDSAPWCDDTDTKTRPCAQAGCGEAGEHRAPKSPHQLNAYHWFCLDHVRDYNARWDFAKGLEPEQIEKLIRLDVSWQRETRPLGDWRARERLLRAKADAFARGENRKAASPTPLDPKIGESLTLMDLTLPCTQKRLRARYYELVKTHHPDKNGGDKEAEERVKEVNLAYAVLRAFLGGGQNK